MKILVLDNYDSFTYNLVQYLQEQSDDPIDVLRNDEMLHKQTQSFCLNKACLN